MPRLKLRPQLRGDYIRIMCGRGRRSISRRNARYAGPLPGVGGDRRPDPPSIRSMRG